MGRGKLSSFDVLKFDKHGYWKRKCGKSGLGKFSSVVSICRNKGPLADWVAHFNHGPQTPSERLFFGSGCIFCKNKLFIAVKYVCCWPGTDPRGWLGVSLFEKPTKATRKTYESNFILHDFVQFRKQVTPGLSKLLCTRATPAITQ